MLDENTFGNSRAAVVLAEKLNRENNPTLTRKVSKFLNSSNKLVSDIDTLTDPHSKRALLNLLLISLPNRQPALPIELYTYTMNVAMAPIKDKLNSLVAENNRLKVNSP